MSFKRIKSGFTMFVGVVMLLAGCGGTSGTATNQMGGAKQGKSLALTGTVSTLAGIPKVALVDGVGAMAQFNDPNGITSDGTNLYVADTGNQVIRKVVIATGAVTTLAGSAGATGSTDGVGAAARFYDPKGITTDGTNLYVADTYNHVIRKVVIATGAVTTLAGKAGAIVGTATGDISQAVYPNADADAGVLSGGSGSSDGIGAAARFRFPSGITTDGTNLYVADTYNHVIRKVVIATGAVTTLSGKVGATVGTATGDISQAVYPNADADAGVLSGGSGSSDGIGAAASFFFPSVITTDGINLYVADSGNSTIRKVEIATGAVTTLAGSAGEYGSSDGTGATARFNDPNGITTDGTNLYVADSFNCTIRKVEIATGTVTTLAGSAGTWGSTDGIGAAAQFRYPSAITVIGSNLYVADSQNDTIRKVEIATGTVTTLAGAGSGGSTNGTGAAARFFFPSGITSDGTNLYVADSGNSTIRKVEIATGTVTTLAGSAVAAGSIDGTATAARFFSPSGITTDGINLYVADTNNHLIRKVVIATGAVTTLAGGPGVPGSADGTGASARFFKPQGITTDGTNLYVADTGNHLIRKVVIATGVVSTLAGSAGTWGSADGSGVSAMFAHPQGITTNGTNLYVADTDNHVIRKVVIATGAVTTLAGDASDRMGTADGTGAAARFYYTYGITTDGTNLYVTESGNGKGSIRKVVIATGAVTTLAGGESEGNGASASFYYPQGVTTDGKRLYVTNSANNTINIIR